MQSANPSVMQLEWNWAPLWESAFKIAEAPMSYVNKLQNKYDYNGGSCFFKIFNTLPTSFEAHAKAIFEGRSLRVITDNLSGLAIDVIAFCIHLYQQKHLIAIGAATAIAFSTTVAMVPFSIIADIFAGVIQSGLRLSQGADKNEILSILHKKVIASPVQQSAYLLTGVVVLGIFGAVPAIRLHDAGYPFVWSCVLSALVISMMLGNLMYCRNQEIVAALPRFFRPDGYNVFIEGGAVAYDGRKANFDPEGDYQKWRAQQTNKASLNYNEASLKYLVENAKREAEKSLGELTMKFPDKFQEIRTWFTSDKQAYELFGFSSLDQVNKDELKEKYKLLVLQCHPDKVQEDERKEAGIWFHLLQEVRLHVEESI
ncbi:MAG: J domain-containing protein [Parachlamydiaceae bacterium]